MTPERTAAWGLASSGALLAIGFSLLCLGGRTDPAGPLAARSPDVSPEQAVEQAHRAEAYARWVLARASADGETVASAARAVRGALAGMAAHPAFEPGLEARLKGVQMDLSARQREALDRFWISFRRNRALRDWGSARRDLTRILAIASDPRSADGRQARRFLDQLSGR